jgi:L-rhamnose mutarotase
MPQALRDAGWHDYSLFLRDDGLLVGYLHTEDLAAARAAMESTEVNARWQAEMAEFFVGLADGRPDLGFQVLDEIFNLDESLRGSARVAEPPSQRWDRSVGGL